MAAQPASVSTTPPSFVSSPSQQQCIPFQHHSRAHSGAVLSYRVLLSGFSLKAFPSKGVCAEYSQCQMYNGNELKRNSSG